MFGQFHYSRAIFAFARATKANPDILTDADLGADSVVIDAGAYLGEWSERIIERYDPVVHAFEPSHRSVEHLETTFAGRSRVHVHELALGGHDGVGELEDAGPGSTITSDGGSAHAALGDAAAPRSSVAVRDVAAVFDELGLDHVDLVKLNIEGGEYDVLDRLAETGWLDRIDLVSVQFHEWLPNAHRRRRRNRRALARTHDEVWCYPWVWELWRRRR
jgi:FkbM family methyltransferase